MKKIILILFLSIILCSKIIQAKENIVLNGYWFECEFSGKKTPPTDICNMLDDDGFEFKKEFAINIKNISSSETNCKKNKVGQCFNFKTKTIKIKTGRSDKIKFQNSNLILSLLGCDQKFKLKINKHFVEAIPDKKKCFWTGKKHFYLKKFVGEVIIVK